MMVMVWASRHSCYTADGWLLHWFKSAERISVPLMSGHLFIDNPIKEKPATDGVIVSQAEPGGALNP